MATFTIQNFGCRASQADGAALEALLAERGFEKSGGDPPGFVILNTCTVTAAADDEIRQTVRRVHRRHPEARIVVTGCYAQREPQQLAALPGVSLVVGNSHKMAMAEILSSATAPFHGEIHVGEIGAAWNGPDASGGNRARPNLKIQDGCNNRCSFCIIPSVRGRSRSAPADRVVEQMFELSAHYSEVVLTGINLGRWGREAGMQMRLAGLLRRLLDETPIRRLRLSSVEPMDFSDDLLELMASSPRIAKHVHAPLQSGSDAVLRRMRRKYRPKHYEDRVRKARELMPEAGIGADVMVGFPGETEAEFQESYEFIERLPFTYLHVFPYSERPGTPAAEAEQVPVEARRKRARLLTELAAAKNREFRSAMIGRRLSAVVLESGTAAMSSNYLHVELASARTPREMVDVEIGAAGAETGLREKAAFPILV